MLNLDPKLVVSYITQMALTQGEPFKAHYLEHLDQLIKIIDDIGEPLEGNILYTHHAQQHGHDFNPDFIEKRQTLSLLACTHESILEIGFNAGFSALLMLTANPDLKLTSVDICEHQYTVPCFEYLRSVFGDRINLINSDSALAWPAVNKLGIDYSAYIIDGGHGLQAAHIDLHNVINYGRKGSVICFDDSDVGELRMLLSMYMATGQLLSIADYNGLFKNHRQMFFINNKP